MADMRPGFHMDKEAIGRIAKTDAGIKARLEKEATEAARKAGGHVETYVTDRSVAAVVVEAEEQAARGVGTRALGESGLRAH